VLYLWLASGARDLPGWPHGTRYLLPILAMALTVGVLRRRPMVALTLMLVEMVTVESAARSPLRWDAGFHSDIRYILILAVDLAVGHIAATRRRRVSIVAAVLTLVVQVTLAAFFKILPGDPVNTSGQDILGIVTAWTIGNTIRQRRRYSEAQRTQAEIQAVQAERLRIARELHDMIAHSIGVIAIQAGVGRRVIDSQPAEARNALTAIEDTSRETLAGLRGMLGTLRRSDPKSDSPPLAPAPGLADLDGLVTRSLDAGVRVEVRWSGDRSPLPKDVDLSAYRIIQEAVTNVVRHAYTDHCLVRIEQREDELSIEVIDDGRGGVPGAGYGITGMRERVGLLHGDFAAGPRPQGGFSVAARIPVPAGVP
jgi:signal transduction histidine kinase